MSARNLIIKDEKLTRSMASFSVDHENKYTKMQRASYDHDARKWSVTTRNPVVGSFDAHNEWPGYERLFDSLPLEVAAIGAARVWPNLQVLDFACGPGRNLVKYAARFARVDGVDISPVNLEKAKTWLELHGLSGVDGSPEAVGDVPRGVSRLWHCNGVDLTCIPESVTYDVVISTIAMQHICVHEIRLNYFREFFRVLKPGGRIAIQMGFGSPSPATVPYYANYYDAIGTNRYCDVAISSPSELQGDLESVGFVAFTYHIGPTGPGDCHPNWIYFSAQKPDRRDHS